MGGSRYNYHSGTGSMVPSSKSKHIEPEEDSLVKACGIIAVCNLYKNKLNPDQLVEELKEENNALYASIKAKNDYIGCAELRGIVQAQARKIGVSTGLHFDCRYCSQKRWEGNDLPLPVGALGLVALKFTNNNDSHWLAFKSNNYYNDCEPPHLLSDERSELYMRTQIVREFPDFDGLGHRLIIWDDYMYDVINHTHSVKCQGINNRNVCKQCMRKSFCSDIVSSVNDNDISCGLSKSQQKKEKDLERAILF